MFSLPEKKSRKKVTIVLGFYRLAGHTKKLYRGCIRIATQGAGLHSCSVVILVLLDVLPSCLLRLHSLIFLSPNMGIMFAYTRVPIRSSCGRCNGVICCVCEVPNDLASGTSRVVPKELITTTAYILRRRDLRGRDLNHDYENIYEPSPGVRPCGSVSGWGWGYRERPR